MDWSFLDKLDKNLLYVYAKSLNKKGVPYFSRELFDITHTFEGDIYQLDEKKELYLAERWRETAYYLIWFVYRYVLDCSTYDEALQYANLETLEKYKIAHFFTKRRIFIGVYKINAVYLYNIKTKDMEDVKIVLDILYNRYDFYEQLECFINHTINKDGIIRSSTYKCQKLLEESRGITLKEKRNSSKQQS